MENKNDLSEGHESPGSGSGLAGNPSARQPEKDAVNKVAGFPGTAENAAGMSAQAHSDDMEEQRCNRSNEQRMDNKNNDAS